MKNVLLINDSGITDMTQEIEEAANNLKFKNATELENTKMSSINRLQEYQADLYELVKKYKSLVKNDMDNIRKVGDNLVAVDTAAKKAVQK